MSRKLLSLFTVLTIGLLPCMNANAAVEFDTEDPMYLTAIEDILSRSGISFKDDHLRFYQKLTYGVNNRLALAADIKYQWDISGPEDGFSNVGLSGIYRLNGGGNGDSKIITDALFGINFGGTRRVRSPDFADTVYHAGVRIGRVWDRLTLAAAVKTSWIFDEMRGMAFIDLTPEAYFRISENWMTGVGFDLRKSTNPNFDEEWANFKLVRKYGRTQYIGHVDYEFESSGWQVGFKLNILF